MKYTSKLSEILKFFSLFVSCMLSFKILKVYQLICYNFEINFHYPHIIACRLKYSTHTFKPILLANLNLPQT